jgi:hypothetical protein
MLSTGATGGSQSETDQQNRLNCSKQNQFVRRMKTRHHIPRQLMQLDSISRSLSETTSLKEVKAIRDKAEAARHYAKSAKLGFKIQNQAAEWKLRAERRAGQLLPDLVVHGGNRKANSSDGKLKLEDLGIDHNQSARWQREAKVPDEIFEQYVAQANAQSTEITAQGLLRLGRLLANGHAKTSPQQDCKRQGAEFYDQSTSGSHNGHPTTSSPSANGNFKPQIQEHFEELKNHRTLLEGLLKPIWTSDVFSFEPAQQRLIVRLLRELKQLIESLENTCSAESASVR